MWAAKGRAVLITTLWGSKDYHIHYFHVSIYESKQLLAVQNPVTVLGRRLFVASCRMCGEEPARKGFTVCIVLAVLGLTGVSILTLALVGRRAV